MRWYRAAAEQDFGPAICNLAAKFERGAGVPQNYAAAFDLYSRAASHHVAAAMQGLGDLHKHGRGIPVNLPMAEAWYRKAREYGYPERDAPES